MKALRSLIPGAATALILLGGCSKVPITGRSQLNLVSSSEIMAMSLSQYQGFLQANPPLPTSDQRVKKVQHIGHALAAAATEYLTEVGAANRVANFEWEFNVVDDSTVNAWCMPGGKVVVYTGLLPVTKDDEGLALVMGHEIAHAIARHGNERISQAIAAQGVGVTLGALAAENPSTANNLFLQAFGVGSQLGMLAYSRKQESEADKMGLVFMAMAGYDPRVAPSFWERMAAQGGAKPPEFLSTHPNDEKRIAALNAYMPEAMKYYKPR